VIIDSSDLGDAGTVDADLAVVGAGPGGIVVALELAAAGLRVVLVESGGSGPEPSPQALSDAKLAAPRLHATMDIAVRRQVGGTSSIWGGRAVPYDPVDFADRPFVRNARWPIAYADVQSYFPRASEWCRSGRAVFSAHDVPTIEQPLAPGLEDDEDVRVSDLERWTLPTDFGKTHREALRTSPNLRLITHLTCVRITADGADATQLECRTATGRRVDVRARRSVLAAGGLETTRLLLNSPAPQGHALGNSSDHLGRWYMSHIEGVAADVQLSTDPRRTVHGYERDVDGTYVRRRFTFTEQFQIEHELPNVAAWFANPPLGRPEHHSGELSLAYLALRSPLGRVAAPDAQRLSLTGQHVPGAPYPAAAPGPLRGHLSNLLTDAGSAARFAVGFGAKRFLVRGRRAPGFFAHSRDNRYPLQYHGEHLPWRDSRVTLSQARDALGMPRLHIDIRFADEDVDGIVRAHEHWDRYLRRRGVGSLVLDRERIAEQVRGNLGGGFHQVGTTRMSRRPEDGVVDTELAVHGAPNVFVASSSTFVTSGQANSTFMIVALAVRLADHLRTLFR
jgi:choline dehydrogenase-like flavoprotein